MTVGPVTSCLSFWYSCLSSSNFSNSVSALMRYCAATWPCFSIFLFSWTSFASAVAPGWSVLGLESGKGGLELLLRAFQKGGEDLFEYVLELRRNTLVVPLLLDVLDVIFVGRVSTAAFSTIRLSLRKTSVEDPSAAKLSGGTWSSCDCGSNLSSDCLRPCPSPLHQDMASTNVLGLTPHSRKCTGTSHRTNPHGR